MAGIGLKLNQIYGKNTLITNIVGMGYSTVVTIAPMLVVMAVLVIIQQLLDFSDLSYAQKDLFSCTVLYIFIFGMLTVSPFNSVISRYLSDVIYDENYGNILPCYYMGMFLHVAAACLLGIPFCLWEYFVGNVEICYVFAGYCGYFLLVLAFYSMSYLSVLKDYGKISYFFFLGMVLSLLLSLIFVEWMHWEVTTAMLVALDIGLLLIAALEFSVIRSYFKVNSGHYKEVLRYFRKYWQLMVTNFLYVLGMCVHNFVFWTTDLRTVVANTFVFSFPYDMATCIAMFTNLSASIIFISRVEMHFHERYKAYSEAVIGGRGMDIELAKKRMFRQLSRELMNLSRVQFMISLILYFLFMFLLPRFGFGGLTIRIYPCLAAGYFIMYLMYAEILFLYYFNDLTGSLLTSIVFMLSTWISAILATHFSDIWYGMGITIGAFLGWTTAYIRLRWIENHFDEHVFCQGNLLKHKHEECPPWKVFDRYEQNTEEKKEG